MVKNKVRCKGLMPSAQQQRVSPGDDLHAVTQISCVCLVIGLLFSLCCVTLRIGTGDFNQTLWMKCLKQILEILNYHLHCEALKTGQKLWKSNHIVAQSGELEEHGNSGIAQWEISNPFPLAVSKERGKNSLCSVNTAMGFNSKWDFHFVILFSCY